MITDEKKSLCTLEENLHSSGQRPANTECLKAFRENKQAYADFNSYLDPENMSFGFVVKSLFVLLSYLRFKDANHRISKFRQQNLFLCAFYFKALDIQ